MATQYVRTAPKKTSTVTREKRQVIHDLQYILVVDCETTIDLEQHLRVAGYCLYDRSQETIEGKLEKEHIKELGFFYDLLNDEELTILQEYAATHNHRIWKRQDFIEKRLYPLLFAGVALVNHNIKFDIGTLATSWYFPDKNTIAMRLCTCTGITGYDDSSTPLVCSLHPSIHTQHLPSGKYLYAIDTVHPVGPVIDTMSLGRALLGPGPMSLKEMGSKFRCEHVKFISEEHGDTLSPQYLDYTMNDVVSTVELFLKELREYNRYGLSTPIASIVSEAGIGKATFKKIGVTPFYQRHTNVPEWYEKIAARCYKGGRSEVMCRLTPVEILYCDFKSQYPLVNALLGLQDLLLAQSVNVVHKDCQAIERWLCHLKVEMLSNSNLWKHLRVFVKIRPTGDILPVETREDGEKLYRNAPTYGVDTWYTLCDVIGSVIRTGIIPHIIDAVEMIPYGKIHTQVVKFFGEEKYSIDASRQDFFAEVINVRTDVKKDMKRYDKLSEEYTYLNSLQLALKLIANSTSYGALCETREVNGIDVAGKYAVYAIASHITAGGRLLLAIAETLGMKRGLRYVMCDTDSMSFARPDDMSREDFHNHVLQIRDFFKPLSPYRKNEKGENVEIFELEEVNGDNPLETPLYFVGISSKRYCCYHRMQDGTYAIKKATVNGVGYVQFDRTLPFPQDVPYPTAKSIYEPTTKLMEYQYLLWYRCIQQVESGETTITIPLEEWSKQIVRHQVTLSTPYMLKLYNYIAGVRPFGFLTYVPNHPNNVHSYYLSGVSTSRDIENGVLYRTKVNTRDDTPVFKRLYEHFQEYFNHAEAKVIDGNKIGWLEKVEVHISDVIARYKTGKVAIEQDTLLSVL